LPEGYEVEFIKKLPAAEWSDRQLFEMGYNLSTLIEIHRRKVFVLAATLRNLRLVAIGQKAVSIRRHRAKFASIVAKVKTGY
jgi:hypothetical protein